MPDPKHYFQGGEPLSENKIAEFMGHTQADVGNIKTNIGVLFKMVEGLETDVKAMTLEINTVKTKFGIYGAIIGSVVGSAVCILGSFLLKKYGG